MDNSRLNREFLAVLVSVTALLLIVSLFSYAQRDPSFNSSTRALDTQNRVGIVGAYLADILLQGFGYAAYLFPLFLCFVAYQMFRSGRNQIAVPKIAGYVLLLLSSAVLLDFFLESEIARESGGIVGGFLKESVLVPLFGRLSTIVIVSAMLLVSIMLLSDNTLFELAAGARK